tara:strand:- start:192 stop:911 length:720 start_codon:yes stop_codon:yes gene_type:complete
MVLDLFLKLLEKCGRKWAIVDFFGKVIQWRYYIFYTESHVDNRWIARLPNLFLHIYPGEKSGAGISPDGANAHSHPYNTWGWIIKGGYSESINEQLVRHTGRFGVAYMSHHDTHRIVTVQPGTVSLFFHGFRVSKWLMHSEPCKSVCSQCQATNNGVCHKTREIKPLDNAIEDTQRDLGGKSWRTIKFVRVDADFESKVANRKEAVAKMNLPELDGRVEEHEFMKTILIAKAKQKEVRT